MEYMFKYCTRVTTGAGLIYGEQNGEKQYYLTNAHGDVDMLADGAGNVIKTYTYDAFGVETNKDETDANPFRYAGEYYDGETDSIYLRARYYAPRTGRFTTEDPIRDGLNWYSYCGGNPVMFVDPWGLGPGDHFETADEAAKDFGIYIAQKSFDEEEEFAAFIYKATDRNAMIYYYYDEPRNDYKTHEERKTSFSISWSGTAPFAVVHTHGGYDANTENMGDGFSTPDNTTSVNPNSSDTAQADSHKTDYYVVTPNGNLRKYVANSGKTEGVLISSDMPVDSRIAIHQEMKNTLLWNLLFINFPKATAQDFVNARRDHPDSLLDTLNALERFR